MGDIDCPARRGHKPTACVTVSTSIKNDISILDYTPFDLDTPFRVYNSDFFFQSIDFQSRRKTTDRIK